MPIKALYCRDEELRTAIAALRELANLKINAASSVDATRQSDAEELKEESVLIARQLLNSARSLQMSIDGAHEQPTADEEKEELRNIVDELFETVGSRLHGTLSEQVRAGVESVKRQRQEAFGAAATLLDDQRIRLEAMRWVMKSALDAPTHKSKNTRLRLGLEAVEEIINELQGIDPDNLARYTAWDWHVGSFNVRKLNAEIYRKDQQIRALKERLEASNEQSRTRSTTESPA